MSALRILRDRTPTVDFVAYRGSVQEALNLVQLVDFDGLESECRANAGAALFGAIDEHIEAVNAWVACDPPDCLRPQIDDVLADHWQQADEYLELAERLLDISPDPGTPA